MADLKKSAGELAIKTAFDQAKDSAERAIEDALLSDEQRAQRNAEQARLAKRRRKRLIALGIVGILLALGVIGLVFAYWQWFLLAGLVGLAALYARYRWHKRRTRQTAPADENATIAPRLAAKERLPAPTLASPAKPTRAESEQEIEDELAALKARVKK